MNTIINFLAGAGLLLIAALLEMFCTNISESCRYTGFIVVMVIEWYYICYLRNNIESN